MSNIKFFLLSSLFLLALSATSRAQTFTQWSGNGHYYSVIGLAPGQGWEVAKLDAEARGGHLVTITSAAENAFVTGLVDDPAYWISQFGDWNFGPYIGFVHPDGAVPHNTTWSWVTGETVTYANWQPLSAEPNNAGGHENYAHLHSVGSTRMGFWNDLNLSYQIQPVAYVLEHPTGVPEPMTIAGFGMGVLALLRAGKRAGRTR